MCYNKYYIIYILYYYIIYYYLLYYIYIQELTSELLVNFMRGPRMWERRPQGEVSEPHKRV